MDGNGNLTQITWEATIIRKDGSREDLGVISYWHRNPFRRLWWWINDR